MLSLIILCLRLSVILTTKYVTYNTWCERSPSHSINYIRFYLLYLSYSWSEHCEPDKPPKYI